MIRKNCWKYWGYSMTKGKESSMEQTEQNRDKKDIVTKLDSEYPPEKEIFLILEMNNDRSFAINDSKTQRSFTIAFTNLAKVKDYMNMLYHGGIIQTKKYRVLPTTMEEYFTRLKNKFGNFDLVIDPLDNH